MIYGKSELLRKLSDMAAKGWSNTQVRDLIDSLWRDPYSLRTSGFVLSGGTDAVIDLQQGGDWVTPEQDHWLTFSIEPVDKKFAFYQYRYKLTYHKRVSSEAINIPLTEGLHIVYYDFDPDSKQEILYVSTPPYAVTPALDWLMVHRCMVASVYFDAENKQIIAWNDQRYGSEWNPQMHRTLRRTLGSLRDTGLVLDGMTVDAAGDDNTHAQFSITPGSVWHGDIYSTSAGLSLGAQITQMIFNASHQPRLVVEPGWAVSFGTLLQYQDDGVLTDATDGYFVLYHIFQTNCRINEFISVPGLTEYEKLIDASLAQQDELETIKEWLPYTDFLYVGTAIFQTSADFTNTPHARIVSFAYGVRTDMSVTGDGSHIKPVKLVNDQHSPGPLNYYGTDGQGIKGYHPLQPDTTITQPGHGFAAGMAIRHDGTVYVRAMADSDVNAQVCGIVSEVIDADKFRYVVDGFIGSVPGELEWAMGAEYFLSPLEAGRLIVLQDPEVWMIGQVRLSLGWGTTRGLKVEIDVGDVVGNYQGSDPFSFDKDFEWCVFAGQAETFKLDFSAGYAYAIARVKLESDGTLPGLAVKINGVEVPGLESMTASPTASTFEAAADNAVVENDVVTIHTTSDYSGMPTVVRVKLIFTIQ